MSIKVLKSYLNECAARGAEPSFPGLRAYRKEVAAC